MLWRELFSGSRGGGFEEFDPGADVVTVVMERTAADEVSIDDAGFVDEDAAADFEVEAAFGNGGHAAAANAVCIGGNFNAMADAGHRFTGGEEVFGGADQIGIVADVFRGAAAGEQNAGVLL